MDEEGKTLANKKVEVLLQTDLRTNKQEWPIARGGTDIWGGLFEGLEILRNAPKDSSVTGSAACLPVVSKRCLTVK
eukprot:3003774-Amphidinium_carterae.1